jgi:hypothetical protein
VAVSWLSPPTNTGVTALAGTLVQGNARMDLEGPAAATLLRGKPSSGDSMVMGDTGSVGASLVATGEAGALACNKPLAWPVAGNIHKRLWPNPG